MPYKIICFLSCIFLIGFSSFFLFSLYSLYKKHSSFCGLKARMDHFEKFSVNLCTSVVCPEWLAEQVWLLHCLCCLSNDRMDPWSEYFSVFIWTRSLCWLWCSWRLTSLLIDCSGHLTEIDWIQKITNKMLIICFNLMKV